ncbi:MAG TPA: GspE/PulE family protein [Geminicoccaceae bacterium]|nr:GspE/PulE family protein [Geminicoccaceae bacterium]
MLQRRSLVRVEPRTARDLLGTTDPRRLSPVVRLLVDSGRLTLEDALRAHLLAAEEGEGLGALLQRMGLVSAKDWAEAMARHHGLELVAADDFPVEPVLPETFSPRFLKNSLILPLHANEETLWLAMVDPGDVQALKAVRLAAGREVVPVVALQEDLEQAYVRFWDSGRSALQRIVDDLGSDGAQAGPQDLEHLIDLAQEAPVVRLVNQLLSDACRSGASDIHIEPYRDRLRVRFRVHGRLREIGAPPARLSAAVVSRIKILARLDIAERRLPQDGRARMNLDGRRVDLRVATVPTMHGESLVIRLLDTSAKGVELGDLGLDPAMEKRFRRQLSAPHGMILVTGPTGSGKTTTLYAGLRELNGVSGKIISIEDPIEYQIDGITQIQVRSDIGLDFARILRSVVRHDPNVIMVGETRDPETADIAVHAALTGHLMLTTLHTNNAAGAIARLMDMGIEAYLLASVLKGVVGQRLVGVLCPACKQAAPATPEEQAFFAAAGIEVAGPLTLHRARGCKECEDMGFVGRLGIFEFLDVTESIRELIRSRAPTQALVARAVEEGMRTMYVDGLHKCLAGATTLEEVCRVTEDW